MSWDSFFASLDSLCQDAADFAGTSPRSVCRLLTADTDGILVADDSSMVSLIGIGGSLRLIGEEEFEKAASALTGVLKTPLSRRCHAVQMVFSCDPGAAEEHISAAMKPVRESAGLLGLNLGRVLDEWGETLASYCTVEKICLAVWTKPSVMTGAELRRARRLAGKESFPPARLSGAQGSRVVLERMRSVHWALVRGIAETFRQISFRADILDSHAAVRFIRAMNVPRLTAPDWRPLLPGDPFPFLAPVAGTAGNDFSAAFLPSLSRQIWPCGVTVLGGRYLLADDRIYAPFVMSLPPQTMRPFNALFRSLLAESLPWRASVLLTGDGLSGQSLRLTAASILSFLSASNRMYRKSMRELQALAQNGEPSVLFQMCFVTWTDRLAYPPGEEELSRALSALSRRQARLMTAVQSWGSSDTSAFTGDPLSLYAATLPAMSCSSPAPKACAPLDDAVRLLPFARPCSPWKNCDLPLRTSDGRFMPLALLSPGMASWNEICFAGMGAGKSFFLNTLNFFFILRPGQAKLPWLTVIDIGMSSSGVISLIRAALPPEKRGLAVFARLRNTSEAAVNVFDTPLGCPYPLPNHADFLVNLLSLLCTPLNETAPGDGVADLLREAMDASYRRLSPDGDAPRRFDPFCDPDVTRRLTERGLMPEAGASWWEAVEALFRAGETDAAVRAQRYAVPLLSDIMAEINNPLVRDRFQGILVSQSSESVPDACVRRLTSAIREYPILANPSRFSLGPARIVSLDLAEVTPRGGPAAERQSGIMYMLARFVGAARFFNTVADLGRIPPLYRSYHRPVFEEMAAAPKRLCYDELHRASCADLNNPLSRQIISDLTTASRESRKQNLSIGLYSQSLDDFPSVLVDLATSVYALGAGNAREAGEIAERFGFSRAAGEALRRITRPTSAGADFVALFRTVDGESVQYLTNTAGAYAKWAFSTTAEDMRVRNRLYDELGCEKALGLLRERYPDGTVRDEIERRRQKIAAAGGAESADIAGAIIEELLAESGLKDRKTK